MAPDQSMATAIKNGNDFYNMLVQHQIARAHGKREEESSARNEAANARAEKMQPYTIKQMLSQMANASAANARQQALLNPRLQQMQYANEKAKRESDPNSKLQQLQNMMAALTGGQIGGNPKQPTNASEMPSTIPAINMGGQEQPNNVDQEQLAENPQSEFDAVNNPQNNSLLNSDQAKRVAAKMLTGIDVLKPTSASAFQGPARTALDMKRLKEQEGEDSQTYKDAKADYDAQKEARQDLSDLRARTKAGLKPGEKEFFDRKTGEFGKEVPLTAKERESEEGNILFNELYPFVYKGAAPFSGEGSIQRLENAAANYKTDSKARKMFDDFLLSDKMLAATTVNEAATLKAGKQNQTFNVLKESLTANDIPKLVKKIIKEYQIPASAQLKAAMRYQEELSKARNKARKTTPATQKFYYNPEMQAKHEAEQMTGSVAPINEKYKDTDMVQVEGPNGIEVMTYAQAKKLGAE